MNAAARVPLLSLGATILAVLGAMAPAKGEEPARILYFEGEPRWEPKFIRRAVQASEDFRLVLLQRTAEHRYSRFAVDSAEELAYGFPQTLEELKRYDALILGSTDVSLFTSEQVQAIADYVHDGASLLLLGGRHAFGAGGWKDSVLEEMVPIDLDPPPEDEYLEVQVYPTSAASDHSALQFAEGADEFFADLPLVFMSPPGALRRGVTELLEGRHEGATVVVLAESSYGKGTCAVFTPWNTWQWEMSLPLDDDRHERFWIGLLRWLAQLE